MISDKKPIQDFVQLLAEHGIHHVIIAPGSRNAPFSLSLNNHALIRTYSIVDERSAGFVAMGMARQLLRPVAVICTSGTAALNLAPAIAEAYYQRVPLLVVTADRPIEWIDQGEGQSIRQRDVYRNYIKASYEIAEEASEGDLVWYNNRLMDEAMRLTSEGVCGPVHINFPLRESLYKTKDDSFSSVKRITRAATQLRLTDAEMNGIRTKIASSDKIMVLAGQMHRDAALQESLVAFAARQNVIVMTEAHSNLADELFITTIDRLIMGFSAEQRTRLVPDLLITVGHNIISRKVKEYLRSGKCEHWHIDISGEGLDTLKHLTKVIPISPSEFFSTLVEQHIPEVASHYRDGLLTLNNNIREKSSQWLGNAPWSDLKAFDTICKHLPEGSDLQMGNSSVVRYVLLSDARNDIQYFGNRGVSGIDGCTSTAVGASYITGKLTTLISGDIGFLYDSNAFWNELVSSNLKIIVINNGGGGIFRIIEGPASAGDAMERFFETPHQRKATSLAVMYGLESREVNSNADLLSGLEWLYQTKGCAILEVMTPRLENDKILKAYFADIKQSVI